MDVGLFAAVLGTVLIAHRVGDMVLQTSHQSIRKGDPGWPGRWACARHVGSYTAAQAAFLVPFWSHLTLWRVVVGLLLTAVTHYLPDRREPLVRAARWLGCGLAGLEVVRPSGADRWGPGTGLLELDQTWHWVWLWVAAWVMAG